MAKTIVGVVSSNKSDKTITVLTHTRKTHPLYKKQYSVSTKFVAHDEKNEAQPGDKVQIVETRPISRRKHFRLEKILEKPALRSDALALTKDEAAKELPKSKSKLTEDKPKKEEAK